MKTIAGYIKSFALYLKTEKGWHDFTDYIRAAVILAAVMAMVRVLWDMLLIGGVTGLFTR
ncbi:MAG: hypothetical protein N2491_07980 [Negativicutes bacterium]|nr:hypothetical protein [Negativicutes bacterium]